MDKKCEARTSYTPGDFGFEPVWCNREIALGSFKDAQGVTRYACQAPGHRIQVKRMYGVWDPRAALDEGLAVFADPEQPTSDEKLDLSVATWGSR